MEELQLKAGGLCAPHSDQSHPVTGGGTSRYLQYLCVSLLTSAQVLRGLVCSSVGAPVLFFLPPRKQKL